MSQLEDRQGIWFVYDGDCPVCTHAATALKIKQEFGELHTLNAREASDDPLVAAINRRELDLDEGMVIYTEGRFYHGKDALRLMARYGERRNPFMWWLKSLFWSDTLARVMYPWMRGTRNWLLRRKGVGRIDNLGLQHEPTFKPIFGDDWDALPTVMKAHYQNRPYSHDETLVKGTLDVMCKPPLSWLAPVMKLMGQIPTRTANNVPTTVRFGSHPDNRGFQFNRVFHFTNGDYGFTSRMVPIKDDVLIEIMRFRLGWKLRIFWDGEKVVLEHKGYALALFGHYIPLPLTLLMGKGYAEEHAIDDHTFEMMTHITHPLWGKLYEYKGRFEVIS